MCHPARQQPTFQKIWIESVNAKEGGPYPSTSDSKPWKACTEIVRPCDEGLGPLVESPAMHSDGWFLHTAVGYGRAKRDATAEEFERRPAPYWRGEAGVSGALDTSSERLTALVGRIAVTALTLLSLYTLLLSALPKAAALLRTPPNKRSPALASALPKPGSNDHAQYSILLRRLFASWE